MINTNQNKNDFSRSSMNTYYGLQEEVEDTNPTPSLFDTFEENNIESPSLNNQTRNRLFHFTRQEVSKLHKRLKKISLSPSKSNNKIFPEQPTDLYPSSEGSSSSKDSNISLNTAYSSRENSDDDKSGLLSDENPLEKQKKLERTILQLSPHKNTFLMKFYRPHAISRSEAGKSLGGAHEFESVLGQLQNEELHTNPVLDTCDRLSDVSDDLNIDVLIKKASRLHHVYSLKKNYGSTQTILIEKSPDKKKLKTFEAIKDFAESINEVFEKMSMISNRHRLYASLPEDITEKTKAPLSTEKFYGKKIVSKAGLPFNILSQEAFIKRVKDKVKKIKGYISKESEARNVKEALFKLDISYLNSLYFVLNRFINIHSNKLEAKYLINLSNLLTLVEDTLFAQAKGESGSPLMTTSSLMYQSVSQQFLQFDTGIHEKNLSQDTRGKLLTALGNITHLEESKEFYTAFISYISHDLCEKETAHFFAKFKEFQEKLSETIQFQKKIVENQEDLSLSSRLKNSPYIISPIQSLGSSSTSLREHMLEGKKLLSEMNEKNKLQQLEKELNIMASNILKPIADGVLNIDPLYSKKAAEKLISFSKMPMTLQDLVDVRDLLDTIRVALHINCVSRLGYKNILTSSSEDDNVFIMSEPLFRLLSKKGLPVFTRKEITQLISSQK